VKNLEHYLLIASPQVHDPEFAETVIIQHLMARLNPEFMVAQVATGMHVNGGCTVFWGLIYQKSQPISRTDVENALQEAGFDFAHGSISPLGFLAGRLQEAREASHIAAPWS
jgi:hypothetical protein